MSEELPIEPPDVWPSAEPDPQRYANRPLLILLENYILDTIGELDEPTERQVAQAVRTAFGGKKDWRTTFRNQLGLDEMIDVEIYELWEKFRDEKADSAAVEPIQYAKFIADVSFADIC
ncbi:hypothetical protein [Thalassoroseus pseudoceratinae]|uniref:hypothetical protein n=1 Tax=Thalassoroseus pseudoceratinae TaxID=2713176 RepID=UPI001423B4AE|nr:hypothetical protein [Thalassoroseus pseudoceratinae]